MLRSRGSLVASDTFDLQGVLTHELGHFSGLGHTMSAHDTMYYTWTPWRNQRTPSLDDKLGLCSIYPVAGDECSGASTGCAAGDTCTATASGRLCEHPADPIGAPCNYDNVECANFCLFTSADLSTGYCSKFCDTNAECPLTHHCGPAMAGTMPVNVCFAGAQPLPIDAAPECLVEEVVKFLSTKGFDNVQEVEVMPENVRFGLPPEIVQAIAAAPSTSPSDPPGWTMSGSPRSPSAR